MANGAVIAIVVIIIVLLLVGLGVGAYYLTRKKGPTGPTGPTNTPTNPPPVIPPSNVPPSGVTGTRILFPNPPNTGPTGPTCPAGPGGTAPEGCSACSTAGIFLCPQSVLAPFNYSQNAQISCFRYPQYDPPNPPITLGGRGYFFREYNNACPA